MGGRVVLMLVTSRRGCASVSMAQTNSPCSPATAVPALIRSTGGGGFGLFGFGGGGGLRVVRNACSTALSSSIRLADFFGAFFDGSGAIAFTIAISFSVA